MPSPVRPRLRPWRRGHALKQKELCSLLGIKSTTHISRIERGARSPSLEIAIACEVLTGEPLNFLFGERYSEVELKTLVRVRKFLRRIEDVQTISAVRKKELLGDILVRAAERNHQPEHVE